MTVQEVEKLLQASSDPEYLRKYEYFGINARSALGIKNPVIKSLAKDIGKNHKLALCLVDHDIHEARFLAVHIAEHKKLTRKEMDFWVQNLYAWDLVDNAAGLFQKTSFAYEKAIQWVEYPGEFIRRAGLVTLLYIAIKDKSATDAHIRSFLDIAEKHATDERNFVKKAVSWLIRQIGKRNTELNNAAIEKANKLIASGNKTARWIGRDAYRELASEKVQERLKMKKAGQ